MERFEALYERYVDGTLDPLEQEEFIRLLEDPVLRRRLVQLQSFEVFISEELHLSTPTLREPVKTPSSRTLPKIRGRQVTSRPRASSSPIPWIVGAAVAAGFLVLLGLGLARPGGAPSKGGEVVRETPFQGRRSDLPSPAPILVPPAPKKEVPRERETRDPEPLVVPPPRSPSEENRPQLPVEQPPRRPEEPAPAPPPTPVREPVPPRDSSTFIARIELAGGGVRVAGERANSGLGLSSGQRIETAKDGYALIRFEDGTRIELGPDTVVGRLSEGAAGKSLFLEQGLLLADVTKQAAGRPFVASSPQAETTVLGTEFSIKAAGTYTRVDVREGRVKVTRLPQAVSSATVSAGQFVVVGPGADLPVRSQPSAWKPPAPGLGFWLRADAGLKSAGDVVTAWADQSPASLVFPATGAPTVVPSAHLGRPAVRFDGARDGFGLPDGWADLRAGLSAFVAVKPQRGGGAHRFLDLDQGPQCDTLVFGGRDSADKLSFWSYANHQTRGKVEAPGVIVPDQFQTFGAVLYPGGRVVLTKNAAVVATGTTSMPALVARKPNQVGRASTGDAAFKGELYEMIVYARALNDAERAHVEGYLLAKYTDATTPGPLLRPTER